MTDLFTELTEYSKSDYYPYHMPGHKRREMGGLSAALAGIDITEIDGFDNLHQPEGLLRELQEQAAELYGAQESFLLINGSSCGILSAISAALPEGGHILMARNCHKSAYHAAYLRNLRISYLYPGLHPELPMYEAITPELVAEALEQEPDIQAVLIVSPTYEGRVANIKKIAEIVHDKNIPLIVDEAHGAHLGFHPAWAQNSNRLGADLVIHSVHKTLPSMTQTALLHVNGNRIDRGRLKRFLRIYQSSSPSYVLMAAIGNVLGVLGQQGQLLFEDFAQQYDEMQQRLQGCEVIRCLHQGVGQDRGKLVLYCRQQFTDRQGRLRKGLSGQELYNILRDRYHLQPEMAAGSYCLAMFTIADGREAYERMLGALTELDEALVTGTLPTAEAEQLMEEISIAEAEQLMSEISTAEAEQLMSEIPTREAVAEPGRVFSERTAILRVSELTAETKRTQTAGTISLKEAWDAPKELLLLSQAAGRRMGEFINLYPPGAPILVPGELLTQEHIQLLSFYLEQGMNVQGLEEQSGKHYVRALK